MLDVSIKKVPIAHICARDPAGRFHPNSFIVYKRSFVYFVCLRLRRLSVPEKQSVVLFSNYSMLTTIMPTLSFVRPKKLLFWREVYRHFLGEPSGVLQQFQVGGYFVRL